MFRIRQLTDELHNRNLKEEREAKALESMVQSVEENLQLMTVCHFFLLNITFKHFRLRHYMDSFIFYTEASC